MPTKANVTKTNHSSPILASLATLFYDSLEDLAIFQPVSVDQMFDPYTTLLAHEHHMTVTVERWHQSPVNVRVLDKQVNDRFYARKILLRRQSDNGVVQFGIVRLRFEYLNDEVRTEIEACRSPLGRVLIQHGVMPEVRLMGLWRVTCGAELSELFSATPSVETFGRTAMIYCGGEPAIELLEIVAPIQPSNKGRSE